MHTITFLVKMKQNSAYKDSIVIDIEWAFIWLLLLSSYRKEKSFFLRFTTDPLITQHISQVQERDDK